MKVNREMAGQLGVTSGPGGQVALRSNLFQPFHHAQLLGRSQHGRRLSSSGAVSTAEITSLQDVRDIPVMPRESQHPLIGDLASVDDGTVMGEYDRHNGFRMLTLSANVSGRGPGNAYEEH